MVTVPAIYYDDLYVPELAQQVLDYLAEFDDETLELVITCQAYCAECQLTRN